MYLVPEEWRQITHHVLNAMPSPPALELTPATNCNFWKPSSIPDLAHLAHELHRCCSLLAFALLSVLCTLKAQTVSDHLDLADFVIQMIIS